MDLGGTGGSGTVTEPDGNGSRRHRGFWNRNWNLFKNRMGMDLGGTGGSGTGAF
jgi:hypothetical protein